MTKENPEQTVDATHDDRADDANALFILGTRYSTGRDVQHDLVAAHKWFNLAAMMGHEEARINRAELAREMSTADVAEAQRQARAWLWSRAQNKPAEPAVPAAPVAQLADAARTPEPAAAGQGGWPVRKSICA
jgi:TPR repeat protein